MKTKEEDLKNVTEVAIPEQINAHEMSFEQMSQVKLKKLKKKSVNEEKKNAKELQIIGRINENTAKLSKLNNKLIESYLDPTSDTITIIMEKQLLEKELNIAMELHTQLFPNSQFTFKQ